MPIRFRCAYCNQLMAIARRKSGTVVRCPTCAGQVIVPSADAVPQGPASNDPRAPLPGGAEGGVFERSDFDKVFDKPVKPAPASTSKGISNGPAALPQPAGTGFDVQPMAGPQPGWPEPPEAGQLSTSKIVLLVIVVLVLMVLSFIAGLLIGRSD